MGWFPWPSSHRRKVEFKGPLFSFDGVSYGGRGTDTIISDTDEAARGFNYKIYHECVRLDLKKIHDLF